MRHPQFPLSRVRNCRLRGPVGSSESERSHSHAEADGKRTSAPRHNFRGLFNKIVEEGGAEEATEKERVKASSADFRTKAAPDTG